MDLTTVLLLHKSSLLVGAVCFLYVRWQSGQSLGLRLMAAAFVLLAVGSSIAAAGERGELPHYAWTLVSFALGPLAYGLFWIGIRRLLTERVFQKDWIVLAVAPVLTLIAVATDFHLTNASRATVFLMVMAAFMASCAVIVLRDRNREAISARFPLALSLAAKTVLALMSIASIVLPDRLPMSVGTIFFLLILCHFFIAMFVQIFAKERAEKRLIRLLETDPLTQIKNRHWFFSHLPAAPAKGDIFAIIDIDHFKQVNDTLGHAAGDQVLMAAAREMAEKLGTDSIFARVGGEEFGLYVPSASLEHVVCQAERLRLAIRHLDISHDGKPIPVTISLGIASAEDGMPMKTLISHADQALYAAKSKGRDRVEIHAADAAGRFGRNALSDCGRGTTDRLQARVISAA